jgi:hypothetical protein
MLQETLAALLSQAQKILEQMLANKNCKLANVRGNGYRVLESVSKTYGGRFPETVTAPELANRMYTAVLEDVNALVRGDKGGGQLVWEVKPAKLLAYEQRSQVGKLATHLEEPKAKRVPESAESRYETIREMERAYDRLALNPNSPRLSVLRGFINDCREHSDFDSAACLAAVKRFIEERNWKVAVQDLQTFLAEERDGLKHSGTKRHARSNPATRDVSEFL